jgi:DNA-binding CsgD family transcriptional regulator
VTTLGAAKNAEVTAREAEVLALIARHLTNAQIAEALFISRRTVETHVSALLRKLQLPDRRSLARHAEAMPGLLVKPGRRGLPLPVTSFVGRTGERTVLAAALAEHRMVTATGPGGIGKTRLALSVAAELAPARREGVWFVDLIQVTDPAMVTAAVAETVGVPEQRTTSVDRALVASLAASDALLVIDNCEHVLDGVRPCVERIIAGCPEVTVLATSRTRLLLPYERGVRRTGIAGHRRRRRCGRPVRRPGDRRDRGPHAAGPRTRGRSVPGAGWHGAGHRAGRGPVRGARPRRAGIRPGPAAAAPRRRPACSRPARLAACAAAPIPASSGKVARHRLNRGGDQQRRGQ